jgi:P27 family predicted phage terminase small subunit
MPGPPPKPLEQKRRTGNPGQKPLPKEGTLIALPTLEAEKPADLGADGAKFWDDSLQVCSGWLGASDYAILRLCSEGMDRRAFILRVLAEQGWSVMTDKGYPYKHPLVGTLGELESQITKWMGLLGMSPADRTRMGVAEVRSMSKLEALQARAAQR